MTSKKAGEVNWGFLVLVVVVVIGVYGISKYVGSGESVKKTVQQIIPPSEPETLKVKGFYLGMSLDDAVKLLNEKYKDILLGEDQYEVFVNTKRAETPPTEQPVRTFYYDYDGFTRYYFDHFVPYNNSIHGGGVRMEADKSGTMVSIRFDSTAVGKLFNAADMDAKSFAQTFMDNYSIPALAPCRRYPRSEYDDAWMCNVS